MKLAYEYEKLFRAMHGLVSNASIKERVANAYLYNLVHLKPNNLPDNLRANLATIQSDFTKEEDEGSGTVMASVRKMTDGEAEQHALKILELFDEVARLYAKQ